MYFASNGARYYQKIMKPSDDSQNTELNCRHFLKSGVGTRSWGEAPRVMDRATAWGLKPFANCRTRVIFHLGQPDRYSA